MDAENVQGVSATGDPYIATFEPGAPFGRLEWTPDGAPSGVGCDVYRASDGTLFVPTDGQGGVGAALRDGQATGNRGGWYRLADGTPALLVDGRPVTLS